MRAYPEQILLMYNNALALKNQGQVQLAYDQCEAILKQFPTYFPALQLIAIIFADRKDYYKSLDYFNRAVASERKNHGAYSNRGNIHQIMKNYDLALKDFDRSISIKRDFAEAYYNKANCLKDMNQHEKAIEIYKKAMVFNPKMADSYLNAGLCYQNLQQFDKALEHYNKAIELNPKDWLGYNNKGYILHCLLRLDESEEAYAQAMARKEVHYDTRFNLGLVQLLKGDYEKGWEGHEIRWHNHFSPIKLPNLWKGEDLTGKTICIVHEQGLGDTIQFCRYIKVFKSMKPKKIIVVIKNEIVPLLNSIKEIDVIVGGYEKMPNYDYQIPFMSIPYVLKTQIDTIPQEFPYLWTDKDKSAYWKDKLKDDKKFKVGLVWSGGFRLDQPDLWAVNNRRNIPLDKLSSLQHPNVSFYSLQKGEFAENELKESKVWNMIDYTSELKDFSDTAALIENLDLIISVDTSTAHVAGAINKPLWLLNRYDTCWRWLLDKDKTNWYHSFKIYRQNKFNDWTNVINDIQRDLHGRFKV